MRRRLRSLLYVTGILYVLAGASPPHSLAATWYVDNSYELSGDGTSNNPASIKDGPGAWNSLAAARGDLKPGDVLEIRKGTGFYREGAWQRRFSGTADDPYLTAPGVAQSRLRRVSPMSGTAETRSKGAAIRMQIIVIGGHRAAVSQTAGLRYGG